MSLSGSGNFSSCNTLPDTTFTLRIGSLVEGTVVVVVVVVVVSVTVVGVQEVATILELFSWLAVDLPASLGL